MIDSLDNDDICRHHKDVRLFESTWACLTQSATFTSTHPLIPERRVNNILIVLFVFWPFDIFILQMVTHSERRVNRNTTPHSRSQRTHLYFNLYPGFGDVLSTWRLSGVQWHILLLAVPKRPPWSCENILLIHRQCGTNKRDLILILILIRSPSSARRLSCWSTWRRRGSMSARWSRRPSRRTTTSSSTPRRSWSRRWRPTRRTGRPCWPPCWRGCRRRYGPPLTLRESL